MFTSPKKKVGPFGHLPQVGFESLSTCIQNFKKWKKHQSTNQIPSLNKFQPIIFVPPDFPALQRKHHRNQSLSKSSEINPKTSSGLPVPSTSVSTSCWGSRLVWMRKNTWDFLGWPNVSVSFRFFLANWIFWREKHKCSTIKVAKLRESFPLLVFKGLGSRSSYVPVPHLEEGSDAIDLRVVHVQAFSDLFLLEKTLLTVMTLKNMEIKNVPFRVDVFPSSNQLSRVDRWAKSQLLVNTCPTL